VPVSEWLARWGIRYWRTRRFWVLGLGRLTLRLRTAEGGLPHPDAGVLRFRCNICGSANEAPVADLEREIPTCVICGSTVRFRAMIHALSLALWGESLALPDFPTRRDIRGMGLTDWRGYALPLAVKLDYANTFLDAEPRLDITRPDPALQGTLDFLLASDVFEHVPPPVERAFAGAYQLLKPGGALVLSVPFTPMGAGASAGASADVEHFPELFDYRLVPTPTGQRLENTTRDGRRQTFTDLRFHGGPGLALEMRQFSRADLLQALGDAGFTEIRLINAPCWEHGIVWLEGHSQPLIARTPAGGLHLRAQPR
jgi:SAM-dependent methyltransferase